MLNHSCSCISEQAEHHFDELILTETNFGLTLEQITKSNIGWFSDKSICEQYIKSWGLKDSSGVYMLWRQHEYCTHHERYRMECIYVGKGKFSARLRNHWHRKYFHEQMIIHFSYFPCPNRQSKYIEQLLLDTYSFSENRIENLGSMVLNQYWQQFDID